jgi:hypothetical protein
MRKELMRFKRMWVHKYFFSKQNGSGYSKGGGWKGRFGRGGWWQIKS